ncbi:MAG: 50S ribosomal protein L29 [Myxococcales bacterium]|nr:50S ribosomal protein L29 [Myxococcales bacterium]
MAKGNTAADLRSKSSEELAQFIQTAQKDLVAARFQNYTNQLNDTSKVTKLRRDIARALTIQTERARANTASASKGEG